MKKSYSSPLVMIEAFTPNEYVAACGDNGTWYNFTCDVSGNDVYYYPVSDGTIDGVYDGSGGAEGLPWGIRGCGKTHKVSNTNEFYDGYISTWHKEYDGCWDWKGHWVEARQGVIVWLERGRKGKIVDGHLTSNLDIESWSVARS